MLKRKIGDFIKDNPFYHTTGTITDTREQTTDEYFDKRYDYKMDWNQRMVDGCGTWAYYDEKELDYLELNWDREMEDKNKKVN